MQNFEQVLADQPANFARVADQLAIDALPDALQDLFHGSYADVGGDERVLQLVEQIGVDLLPAGDDVFEAIDEAGARLLDAGFQAVEQVGFLGNGTK